MRQPGPHHLRQPGAKSRHRIHGRRVVGHLCLGPDGAAFGESGGGQTTEDPGARSARPHPLFRQKRQKEWRGLRCSASTGITSETQTDRSSDSSPSSPTSPNKSVWSGNCQEPGDTAGDNRLPAVRFLRPRPRWPLHLAKRRLERMLGRRSRADRRGGVQGSWRTGKVARQQSPRLCRRKVERETTFLLHGEECTCLAVLAPIQDSEERYGISASTSI